MQGIEATPQLGHRLVTRNLTCRYSPGCRTTLKSRIREEQANGQQPRNQMHKVAVAQQDALIGAGGRANMLSDRDDNAPRNRAFKGDNGNGNGNTLLAGL